VAFFWNTNPNPPAREMPQAVPPGEVTYQVHVIANSVDPKCSVTYNTTNVGYDELCQLASTNVGVANFTNAFFDNFTANTANISTATFDTANIQTANILNANIRYGYVGSDPTANLGIASKHYVDAAMANVPAGGSDLQNIIDARGDLLVGISANTGGRLPVGNSGDTLIADSTTSTGLRWRSTGSDAVLSQSVLNLTLFTHYDPWLRNRQLLLYRADEIVMASGQRVAEWSNVIVDITLSGAGGLDTGVEAASHWYEVHAIRNSSNGATALILHRAPETIMDQSFTTTTDNGRNLRNVGQFPLLSQSFIPAVAGPLTSVEIEVSKTGSPTGLIWVTLESDDANNVGFPDGVALATSRVMDVSRLPTDKARIRFLFDTNTSVSLSTTYHLVYQSDYTISDANYTTIWGITAGGYTNGRANEYHSGFSIWRQCVSNGGPGDFWFKTFVQGTPFTAVTLPSGYDQRCLISYVYNDSASNFKKYSQRDRQLFYGVSMDWRAFTSVTGLIEAVDLTAFIPPVVGLVGFMVQSPPVNLARYIPIGGVACTDLSLDNVASTGAMSANTYRISGGTGTTITNYGPIVVEKQVILTRTKAANTRLYVQSVSF
jgi:hypothetical protein